MFARIIHKLASGPEAFKLDKQKLQIENNMTWIKIPNGRRQISLL